MERTFALFEGCEKFEHIVRVHLRCQRVTIL